MITRDKIQKDIILYSESLNCHPVEGQAAKIYIKWLKEHPNYSMDTVNMRIDYRERDEDAHGNGGGYDKYVRIYQVREETQEEYDARITQEEDILLGGFHRKLRSSLQKLIEDLNLYSVLESRQKVTECLDSMDEAIMRTLTEKIHQTTKEQL